MCLSFIIKEYDPFGRFDLLLRSLIYRKIAEKSRIELASDFLFRTLNAGNSYDEMLTEIIVKGYFLFF